MNADLKAHWDEAWAALRLSPPAELYAQVTGCYLEPHRAYHTLHHLEECFALFGPARALCVHPGEVLLGLWLHDAVYQPKRRDSEEKSAQWADEILRAAGAPAEVGERVRDLILATKHEAQPSNADARVLVDIDLSILAAEPARFDEYEEQVRKEYAHVPDLLFRIGRGKVLKGFVARASIYSMPHFREPFEARARANIARSLARL